MIIVTIAYLCFGNRQECSKRLPLNPDVRFRPRLPFTLSYVPPPPASLEDAPLIPEATAGWFNILTFGWITYTLALGYARPLEASDLYKLQDKQSAKIIGDKITASYVAREKKAREFNARLANGEVKPGLRALWWSLRGKRAEREKEWREKGGMQRASLVWAMNDAVKYWFWSGFVLKLAADIATILSPLLVKALINFATESFRQVMISENINIQSDELYFD